MSEKSGDCYVDVWRDINFEGEEIRIYGPAEHPNLNFAQGDWGDDIGSLRVGPNAFVLAYSDRNFTDRMIAFGPNDEVANLGELRFDDDIESIKVVESLKIFDCLTDASATDAAGESPIRDDSQPHPSRIKKHGQSKRH